MKYIATIKYLLLFFILCQSTFASVYQRPFAIVRNALQEAAQQDPHHLGRIFSRVITHGLDKFDQTSPFNHYKHMHHNNAAFWPTSDITTTKTVNMFSAPTNSPLLEFYKTLYERSQSPNFKGVINSSLMLPQSLSQYELTNYERRASYLPRGHRSFINGHQRSFFEYGVPFPLIVVSFFDSIDASDIIKYPLGKPQKWYAPLEQALLIASKKQYINDFAILDGNKQNGGWGDYSKFTLTVIPPSTTLYGHFGLTASQKNENGGASQFYIPAAKTIKGTQLFSLDALDTATGEINFVKNLVDIGLIYPEESDVFYKLRNGFKEYYDVYEQEQ